MTEPRKPPTATPARRHLPVLPADDGARELPASAPRSTHASAVSLRELLPIGQLQCLLDAFNAFFPAVTAILDLEGHVLQASGWQDACTKFHRADAASCRNCTESDTYLAHHVAPGEFVAYRCKNGLWDVVTPLYVDGVHAGNVYTGQFLYDDELLDETAFEAQARHFGYDLPAYMEAIRRVPRVSRDHVKSVMTFVVQLTSLLSQLGQANVHLAKELTERQRLFDQLQVEQENRRKLERSMLEAQKLESLGMLAGGIAHDFNNLLTAITCNIELARHGVYPASEASHALTQGLAATNRARDLTRQMLAYSGRGRFVVENVNVTELVIENSAMLRASVPKRVVLELDLAEPPLQVLSDKSQLQQVIMNLLINASEAIGDRPGTVRLRTSLVALDDHGVPNNRLQTHPAAGRYCVLEVSDTGCGMDEATLARVFDPFFTTKFTGRGLGMAAVHGIVTGHAGAIMLESTPGAGTTVRVFLPAAAPSAPTRATPAKLQLDRLRGPRGTALIVDDEPMVAASMRKLLERRDFTVLVAEDGLQAIALATTSFVVAFVDLTMPGMSGTTVAAELIRLQPTLPVVLCSGYDLEPVASQAAETGVVAFLQKPFTGDALDAALETALAPSRDEDDVGLE